MFLPNCFLSLTYLTQMSQAPSEIPQATAPIEIRPASSVCIIILKPWPSLPIRFSAGITQFSKIRSAVAEPLIPIFFSCLPNEKPGVSFSTMKVEIPWLPRDLSVIAETIYVSASPAFVIKHFVPLSIYVSPSFTAFVCCMEESVPAPGSVRAKAPSFLPDKRSGRYFFFCSGVPN